MNGIDLAAISDKCNGHIHEREAWSPRLLVSTASSASRWAGSRAAALEAAEATEERPACSAGRPLAKQPIAAKACTGALKDVLWRLIALPIEHYRQGEASTGTIGL